MRFSRREAQSLIEYVTLISIVTMAMTILFPMVKRAVQSVVKTGADHIGSQAVGPSPAGYFTETQSSTEANISQKSTQSPGQMQRMDVETIKLKSRSSTNM